MPKITEIFGMTFAKKWTYGAPEICQNRNEPTYRQNIAHLDIFRQLAQVHITDLMLSQENMATSYDRYPGLSKLTKC